MTSTDLDRVQESSLEVLPPAQPPSVSAQRMLVAHAEMMQTAWELASKMCNTRMVPARFFGKPEDGTAAILYGAELGMNPIQSLQRVIPIHGMPSLEARTMVALLKARGYRVKTVSQSNESATVEGWDLEGEHYESTWTIERALQAGYVPEIDERTGKYKTNANGKLKGNEKYITDPQTMLKAKAQAEVCRDMAPDVLMGITYSREELESENFDSSAFDARGAAAAKVSEPVTVDEIMGTTETAGAAPDAEEARADSSETQPEAPAQPQPQPDPADELGDESGYDTPDPEPDTTASENGVKPEPEQVDASETVEKVDTPPAEPEPEKAKSQTRKALERRLFKLLAIADIARENRADRLIIYRAITGKAVASTDDLNDVEVAAICDQLYAWDKKSELGQQVTDILNTATLDEMAAEEQQQSTETQGE